MTHPVLFGLQSHNQTSTSGSRLSSSLPAIERRDSPVKPRGQQKAATLTSLVHWMGIQKFSWFFIYALISLGMLNMA